MRSRLFALTAVAATLLTATVAAAPTAVAAPGDPNQVALRVEYPDGTSYQECVPYSPGMSGAEVLALSKAKPTYGSGPYNGFVLKINGKGTAPPTNDDYWAYWTTTNGTLTYSSSGVTSTRPQAGTVEAWHWNSKAAADPEKPSAGSYRSICPGGYEQASQSAPATTPATAAGGGAVRTTAPTTAGGGAGTTTSTSTTTVPDATAPATPGATTTPGTPGAAAAAPSTSPGGTGGVGRTVDASPVAVSTDTGGSGKPLGLALAAVAVVALGAAAAWQRRRRSATDE